MRISDWSSDVCSSDLVAVVGNKDVVAGVIDEVIFQPLHAFSVKMVGRFVKQQNVRLFQQQTAKRDAALFTARKRSHVRIARRAAQRLDRKEHTSELQSLMRISYAVFCLKKKNTSRSITSHTHQ